MKKTLLMTFLVASTSFLMAQIPIYWTSAHGADSVSYFYKRDTVLYNMALDLKVNLTKATGLSYTVSNTPTTTPYPTSGILLIADSNYVSTNREQCSIDGNGVDLLTFTATYNHGVNYGVYQYLEDLGFRFYLPDTLWEVIPTFASPFAFPSKIVEPILSLRAPLVTGGLGYSPVDSSGESLRIWYQWFDRNNMRGEYEVAGHNDWDQDINAIMSGIPCSIAEHDSSIALNPGSVPNIDNSVGLTAWGSHLAGIWKGIKKITANDGYINHMRTIDLPDGSRYGNTNTLGCYTSDVMYPSPSEQRFIIQNRVTEIMQDSIPGTQTWTLSYDVAADTPTVDIHPDLNVTVTMGFQNETSNISLMKRWKNKMPNVSKLSEYNYMNMPYAGLYPYTDLNYFKSVYNRMQNWGTDGTLNELGIDKFANGMHLYAFNRFSKEGNDIDTSRLNFINDMFGPAAGPIKELFDLWSTEGAYTTGGYVFQNRHRYPKYFQLLQDADALASGNVSKRIAELKVFMHYMILNDDFYAKTDSTSRFDNGTALATYIAKISSRNIINSYAALFMLANDVLLVDYTDTAFYYTWEPVQTRTLWDPGVSGSINPIWNTITPLTDLEVENDFLADVARFTPFTTNYNYESAQSIINQISINGLETKDTIHFTIEKEAYYQTIGWTIYAPSAGALTIIYDSLAASHSGDNIFNFSIDREDQLYSQEQRINALNGVSGQFNLTFPSAGTYTFIIAKPTYGGGQFHFVTNGNIMYRGAYFPTLFESYTSIYEAATSVFVPSGQDKLYLTIDACGDAGCIDTTFFNDLVYAEYISPSGDTASLMPTADSTLFYIDIPSGQDGKFWKIYHKNTNAYGMSLANISNYYFWLQPALPVNVKKRMAGAWNIYPNPSSGDLSITAPNGVANAQMSVTDMMGKVIYKTTLAFQNGSVFNTHIALPSGIYFINVDYGDDHVTKKWIKL
jgi:hypothetical protein